MKWHQTWPNVVKFNERTSEKRRLVFALQMALLSTIWPSSWLYIPPKPPWWQRIIRCPETVCQILVWRGKWEEEEGGAEGSPGINAELPDKRDIVALTDPSKKTLLPVPTDPASSAHEVLTSQNWKSLLKHHLLLYTQWTVENLVFANL